MIVVLNGPLGIGKSSLAEALCESIDSCAMLDGDALVFVNPPASDELEHLHQAIALLVEHHRGYGYRHFVINHLWTSPYELDALRSKLIEVYPGVEIRCFLLTLSEAENRERIERREGVRAIDEREFALKTVTEEREALAANTGDALGEPFDVSAQIGDLVARMIARLGDL